MSDYETQKAANEYTDKLAQARRLAEESPTRLVSDAFIAGVEWARAQWPITPRTAEEAKPEDFGQALGLMWADLGKKLEEVSIWCGSLEGQANRIQRETQEAIGTLGEGMAEILKTGKEILWLSKHPYHVVNDRVPMSTESLLAEFQSVRDHVVDVGQKVEAVISLVDDLDELIRSEDGEAEPLTAEELGVFKEGVDEAYRPAVGMFGIGGDAAMASTHRPERMHFPDRVAAAVARELYDETDVVTPLRPVVIGVDIGSPDGDETVMIAQDGEGRMHPITPPGWAGKIRDVFIHNNQLFVQCEAGLFAHFGGKTLTPLEFGA